jgi:hypothetical protein
MRKIMVLFELQIVVNHENIYLYFMYYVKWLKEWELLVAAVKLGNEVCVGHFLLWLLTQEQKENSLSVTSDLDEYS